MKTCLFVSLSLCLFVSCASVDPINLERSSDISDLHITYLGSIELKSINSTYDKDYNFLLSCYNNGRVGLSEASIQRLNMDGIDAKSLFSITFGSIRGLLGLSDPIQQPIIPMLKSLGGSK